MRILIVGAGYVGTAFGKAAKEKGHQIFVASRTSEKISEYLMWADGAFLWERKLPDAIDGVLLAVAPREKSYEETYLENAKAIKSAPYIVYTSSTSVYGDHRGKTVNELTVPRPQNPNQKILLETEAALPLEKTAIFRLGEITGPGRARKVPEIVPGNGESICNFSPLPLIISALLEAFESKKVGLFNLVSDDHPTRKEYYLNLAQAQGLKSPRFDPSIKSPHGGNKLVTSLYR